MNLSSILNTALKGLLSQSEEEISDEQVAEIFRQKNARVENIVKKEADAIDTAREEALRLLQSGWNQYVGEDPTHSTSQKLAWIDGRRGDFPALKALTNQELLQELQGA